MTNVPLLDQSIGAWFAGVAKQDEYYNVMIVTVDHMVVTMTLNNEGIELIYDEETLTEVRVTPQFIDFSDKAFTTLKKKEIPKQFCWKLIPPLNAQGNDPIPRICMIHPYGVVPADRLSLTQ